MHEADLRNISKIEIQSKTDLEIAQENYAKALEEEKNIENLSPKEKAINLLDTIIDALKGMGSGGNGIYQKAIELKDQLIQILNIASAQSKSLTDEFLSRQNSLADLIKENAKKKSLTETELNDLVKRKSNIEQELEAFITNRNKVDDLIRDMESKRSVAAADLRSLESEINSLKLELRTFEVNLENASHALTKEGINPSDLNPSDFQGMDLIELEGSLDKIQELRDLENKRSVAELDLRSISEKVTNIKLELKTYEINLENANERIKKAGINIEDVNYEDYEDLVIKDIQDLLAEIQAKIIRLGAINLAAPDEIAEESKRGEKLEEQYDELTEALDKLTNAIKKIDVETKSRFKDSFDAVNARLKEVFPILFGGGFAELTLQDNDTLNGGVVLMARPPGKKNASISQLSGGEKALTALSLVFSIFELNPAPFCMLDEVDAPLDDLNTQRLINMVEEMSKTIQFIFITHNKVSMERSDHLMGITMQEAGVSRLVSVDVKQALELANTD